jgi:tetratricopeptide (TPR) repeat protein
VTHYQSDALVEYVDGLSDGAERIEAHLDACVRCANEVAEIRSSFRAMYDGRKWEPGPPPVHATIPFAEILELAGRLQEEDAMARPLCAEVLAAPPAWWAQHIRHRVGTHTAGVIRELLARMRLTVEKSPATALQMTTVAVELAAALDTGAYPHPVPTILQAQALRTHASVLSFMGSHREAIARADEARALFERIPGMSFELARTAMVKAGSLQLVDRVDEALALLREAADTFHDHREYEWHANARMTEGAVLYNRGAIRRALEIWRSIAGDRALGELGTVRVRHNIALCLVDLGEPAAAATEVRRCIADFERLDHPTERTRSRMVLGMALLAAGDAEEAIAVLRQTCREYAEFELLVDAAYASLQLVEALLVTNRPQEVPAICREAIALCTQAGMHQQALNALAFLREALALGKATPGLVREIHSFLRRQWGEQARVFGVGAGGRE